MIFSRESFHTDLKAKKPEYGSMLTRGMHIKDMPTPENAQNFVDFLNEIRGIKLDYSIASLYYAEAVLEGLYIDHKDIDRNAVFIFSIGCYIGEVLSKPCGGRWFNSKDIISPVKVMSMAVVMKLPSGLCIDPIAKAFRRSYYGSTDSIVDYYMEITSFNS